MSRARPLGRTTATRPLREDPERVQEAAEDALAKRGVAASEPCAAALVLMYRQQVHASESGQWRAFTEQLNALRAARAALSPEPGSIMAMQLPPMMTTPLVNAHVVDAAREHLDNIIVDLENRTAGLADWFRTTSATGGPERDGPLIQMLVDAAQLDHAEGAERWHCSTLAALLVVGNVQGWANQKRVTFAMLVDRVKAAQLRCREQIEAVRAQPSRIQKIVELFESWRNHAEGELQTTSTVVAADGKTIRGEVVFRKPKNRT
jgi:hypothetical protein